MQQSGLCAVIYEALYKSYMSTYSITQQKTKRFTFVLRDKKDFIKRVSGAEMEKRIAVDTIVCYDKQHGKQVLGGKKGERIRCK